MSETLHDGGKESPHGSKDVEKGHFAHTLGATLDQAMRSKRFGHWVLVAPPHFVGIMKKELTSELEKHLMTTVDKDFAHLAEKDLGERLHDAVQVPLDQLDATSHETVRHAH
ncbi:MAG: host attachment protein [Polyangiaceae bacterium]